MPRCEHISRRAGEQRQCVRAEGHAGLHRVRGLTAHAVLPAVSRKPGQTRGDDIPAPVRAEVKARSGGICECGCGRRAEHMHHRKLRSQGGRHEAVNLLHLTFDCHEAAHRNRPRAEALGLIVPSWADPADVPVVRLERAS